jgi:hypothetical protein
LKNGIKADRLNSTGLVKLNQLILTKLLQEKHTTEELKFLIKKNKFSKIFITPRFIGAFLFYEMINIFFR